MAGPRWDPSRASLRRTLAADGGIGAAPEPAGAGSDGVPGAGAPPGAVAPPAGLRCAGVDPAGFAGPWDEVGFAVSPDAPGVTESPDVPGFAGPSDALFADA
ncbi:hypothetical protein AB0L06_38080 [Spirillospora sp. NPDC052269]